jgi:mono/diheme cytochrome c family protein
MIYGMALAVGIALLAGLALLYSGIYSVAATSQHTPPVYWALEQGMRASVRRRAQQVNPPPRIDAALLHKGAQCYDLHCAQCHGAPGRAPQDMGKGMQPLASSLVQTGRDWPVEQIYWVARNGLRMTGMPAWEWRLGEQELWATAAFVSQELPRLDVARYTQLLAASATARCELPSTSASPDAARGRVTIRQYGCHGCHIIPGIVGPDVHVGPSLREFARRPLIAGSIPNTPENLIRWLRNPQALRPHSLMPDLGVTEQHARDMRAYLATLE